MKSNDPDQVRIIEIVTFAIPCAFGLLLGFVNVKIRGKRDKADIMWISPRQGVCVQVIQFAGFGYTVDKVRFGKGRRAPQKSLN